MSFKRVGFWLVVATIACVGCGEDRQTMMGGGTGGGAGVGAGFGGGAGYGGAGGVGGAGGAGGAGGGGGQTLEQRFPSVTDWNALEIIYSPMYSAFVPGLTFKVPARAKCTNLQVNQWHADPPTAVTFDADPDNANGVMITIVEPVANITIAAVNGPLAGRTTLNVTVGTQAEWEKGEYRYNNGADWSLDILNPTAPPPDTKCTVCHSANSSTTFDIQHTPTQAARISDAALEQIMTTGTKPADVTFRVLPDTITFGFMTFTNAQLYEMFHLWDATGEDLKGMILYLRSLTPRGQGCVTDPSDGVCKDVEDDPNAECN